MRRLIQWLAFFAEDFWDKLFGESEWYRGVSGGEWESYDVAGWTQWRQRR